MKTYEELSKLSDYHWNEHSRILGEMVRHPEFIKHYFSVLNISDEDNKLNNLIGRINVIHSNYSNYTFSFDENHYMISRQICEDHLIGAELFVNGTSEGSQEEVDYKKSKRKNVSKIFIDYLKRYFRNGKSSHYLNSMMEYSSLDDFEKVAFMLVLSNILERRR